MIYISLSSKVVERGYYDSTLDFEIGEYTGSSRVILEGNMCHLSINEWPPVITVKFDLQFDVELALSVAGIFFTRDREKFGRTEILDFYEMEVTNPAITPRDSMNLTLTLNSDTE